MTTLSKPTKALELALATIRKHHPDVRPAILTIYRHESTRLGHYERSCWTSNGQQIANSPAGNEPLDEIHIDSIVLDDGPVEVLHTILHEAAHSVAVTRKIQDTSRDGRYHNARFAVLAHELGLVCAAHPRHGIITTGLQPGLTMRYAEEISLIRESTGLSQRRPESTTTISGAAEEEDEGKEEKTNKNRQLKLTCQKCGRIIRASQRSIDAGPIACVPCLSVFIPEDEA